jgi:predicted unusual protein kinase regulating ubiquinone biosynthesis (AarF/ABC1/UbiB family)/nucleotide-binding universal stress UspA family protein
MSLRERFRGEPMRMTRGEVVAVHRVMVATDFSETANRAVRWAANVAASHQAELLLFQVLPAIAEDETEVVSALEDTLDLAEEKLRQFAAELVGRRKRARVVVDDDPAQAILDAVEEERVDMIVVGNVGMSGRKQFLLGNIPNRISHNARCTVVIVNTAPPDRRGASGRQREVSDVSDGVEGRLLGRAWRIGRVMVKAGARELLTRSQPDDGETMRVAAQRFRSALDELGPTFAKLGQILSTRPDLLPSAFMKELETLQERVTPLTEAEVVSVMERELGIPWEDVFESIDPKPLAAGTIAQVHRATLESGDRVVVKVQRPTAEQDILQDLGLLKMFAQKAANRPALRQVFDVPAIVEHLSNSLRRELDFRHEAANIRRMQEVIKPFPRLQVPAVYEEYSTARVLVMQEVQGVPVREAPHGPARKEAARQLLESYYHQVMVEGFFHADPHPGNMKWWNEKIYFLDLGMAGEVDAELRELILLILLAFSQRDAAFLSEVVLVLADGDGRGDAVDFAAFREDMEHLIARYRDLSLRELRLGPILQEVTEISVRRNVRVPASLTLTGKAFGQMQMTAAELDPDLDLFSVAESFVLRNTLRQLTSGLDPKKIFYETQKARVRLVRLLEAVEGAVGARPGARLQVDFRGTEPLEDTIDQASRRLSFALGLGGTLVATAITANSTQAPRWVLATMGSIGSALAAGLLIDRSRRRE